MSHAAVETVCKIAAGEQLSLFSGALRVGGFSGEISADAATRTVFSGDNSIYQVRPEAVLFPENAADLQLAAKIAASGDFDGLSLTARGGGTGTNGQSLTSGIVVDTSRHMNRILSLDVDKRLVTVEPGVVLNQLNAYLKPHGLFFPPTVSTASRATIGGMVATDASGKGSRIYGKTSDYVEAMDVVLSDGETLRVEALSPEALDALCAEDTLAGRIHREVRRVVTERAGLIAETFPRMNRGLTGYNLKHVIGEDGRFRLSYLLSGSEGTLALTSRLTLRVKPLPSYKAIACIRYASFQTALEDVRRLLAAEPAAIEILDDKVLSLARDDEVWAALEDVLGGAASAPVDGFNVVEFVGDSEAEIEAGLARLTALLNENPGIALDWTLVRDSRLMAQIWSLREKSVGLLGRLGGARQGTAFVEDAAVPPENLAEFIREFRGILDNHGLSYGMFGHADVGCLHVRPALNMRDPADAALIRPISDAVAALTKRHGGLLWGEHGRGFRGEYSPFFFGPELYDELCRIKAVFDPKNIFNPGKLAKPSAEAKIDPIDAVPMRGAFDRAIAEPLARAFAPAIACNGNGACHNRDAFDAMCPSFKATGDRLQSPKGRAALLREWARLENDDTAKEKDIAAIEDGLKATLDTCLSCKACAGQCPVKVDIPAMKSRFLDHYYQTRRRPSRDRLMARMETLSTIGARLSGPANAVLSSAPGRAIAKHVFGLVDLPKFSKARPTPALSKAEIAALAALPENARVKTVILLEDTFTSHFDGQTVEAVGRLLKALGLDVRRAGAMPNGKALHVLGLRDAFKPVARRQAAYRTALLSTGLPVIGIEPVAVSMQDHEYEEFAPAQEGQARVLTLESFLARELESGRLAPPKPLEIRKKFRLFLHCTEKTTRPRTANLWKAVFAAFGVEAQTPATGCCGMAGLFGHQHEHQEMSQTLFDKSWRPQLSADAQDTMLATGFSCRCQTERFAGFRPFHPAEALLATLTNQQAIEESSCPVI